jgi:hypothetical protein
LRVTLQPALRQFILVAACNNRVRAMLTLYSYPELFGVADNNGYGLKVFAFLRLCGVPFKHEYIVDASAAPRGQLPYIADDGETIGDSDTIIAFLIRKYRLTIDDALTPAQRDTNLLIARMLDDLYWVMSYSRWKDDRYWPAFRDALLQQHPSLTEAALQKARCLCPRCRRSGCIGRPYSAGTFSAWGKADQHRCRHLRLHCQYLFLRHRNAAEAVRRRAR